MPPTKQLANQPTNQPMQSFPFFEATFVDISDVRHSAHLGVTAELPS